jgi:mRNA-degrading endonuclease toxin of MazEF toxin-antitoxin module
MSCQDRRNHIRMLRRSEAVQRKNIIRLTSPHTDVTLEPAKPRYSVALSSRIINENWKITLVCPLERDCLGVMAILSQATCGQPWVLECLLVNEITKIQTSHRILQERDVLKVIENLYEEADVIGTNWDNEAEQVTEAGETINL